MIAWNRGWKQWRGAGRRYTRPNGVHINFWRTFSGYIIAKASRNYQPWDIFQSRLRLFGPIEPEIEWIVCTTVTANAITSLSPARGTTHPPRCITIVNSIWIAARLDRTVNYVRMTVRLARICSVDPFEGIAIDWLCILSHSFFPSIAHALSANQKLWEFMRNHHGSFYLLVRFLFRGLFYRTRLEADAFSVASPATLVLIKTKNGHRNLWPLRSFTLPPLAFSFSFPPSLNPSIPRPPIYSRCCAVGSFSC